MSGVYDSGMNPELEQDQDGVVVTRPVTDYSTHSVYATTVLLRVEYVETELELQTGVRHQIQLLLTRQGALDVAELLRKSAVRVQEPISDQPIH